MLGTECQLCGRKFSNGKALGGHMRTHFASLPIPPKKQIDPKEQKPSDAFNDSASSVISSVEKGETSGMVDVDFSDVGSEGEGEMEILEMEEEEDVALSLVMLSKDVHVRNGGDEKNESMGANTNANTKGFECEICGKVFQRSQGLGSHRLSHHRKMEKKMKSSTSSSAVVDRDHVCPVCGKVFGCGKALGGHKRSHNLIEKSSGTKKGKSVVVKFEDDEDRSIDLNKAADDEDRSIDLNKAADDKDEEDEEEFDVTSN